MSTILPAIAAAITLASCGYCAASIFAALQYTKGSRKPPSASELPPISILKPLRGTDPEMYESLRSHCIQNYPNYEIVFGTSERGDLAVPLIEALRREFPSCPIRLIECMKVLGANRKVSTLAQISRIATYDVFVVNDSDIRVPQDYLSTISAELQQDGVGLVTCCYRAVPGQGIWSQIESLGITTDFMAGVLVARQIEGGLHFALGSTLAFRRRDLEAIGGFEAIADYLADDYQLGNRVAESGKKVELSATVVETFLPHYRVADFISHQLRWARTIRSSRPAGYAGLALTFTLPWAILLLLLVHSAPWAVALLVVACVLRFAMATITAKFVLHDRSFVRSCWLLPLRDMLAPCIWLAGLFGKTIVWRGQTFKLDRGKLIRAEI